MSSIPFTFPDITVQEVISTEASLTVVAVSCQGEARCPQDLPISGQTVQLVLRVQRFRCGNPDCPRKTFVERLPEVVPLYGHRTTRLKATLIPCLP